MSECCLASMARRAASKFLSKFDINFPFFFFSAYATQTTECVAEAHNDHVQRRIYASVATACYGVLPGSFSVLQCLVNLPFLSFTNDKDIDD